MLTTETVVSQLVVTEGNCVQIRTSTRVMEDGVKLSESYHRKVISPGDDYSSEDAIVQSVCAALHTPEMIATYLAAQQKI